MPGSTTTTQSGLALPAAAVITFAIDTSTVNAVSAPGSHAEQAGARPRSTTIIAAIVIATIIVYLAPQAAGNPQTRRQGLVQ